MLFLLILLVSCSYLLGRYYRRPIVRETRKIKVSIFAHNTETGKEETKDIEPSIGSLFYWDFNDIHSLRIHTTLEDKVE